MKLSWHQYVQLAVHPRPIKVVVPMFLQLQRWLILIMCNVLTAKEDLMNILLRGT